MKTRWVKLQALIADARDNLPNQGRLLPLQAIDPSTAMMIGYDQRRLFCVSSEIHNKLAYDIALKSLVSYLQQHPSIQ